jgi:hypothetical protein
MVTGYYDALIHTLCKLVASQDEGETWAMTHLSGDDDEKVALIDTAKNLIRRAEG